MQEEMDEYDPSNANPKDLFGYGTVAKIAGVQGRRTDEIALLLEGTRRFKIDKIAQKKPFFTAKVTYVDDESGYWYQFESIRANHRHSG